MPAPALSTEREYARVSVSGAQPLSDEEARHRYCVDEIIRCIAEGGYRSPCLQFPDDLVGDSTQVASLILRLSGVKCFVLADTSYSPCCVDEIAAQHVNGDVIFHFGNACLNRGRKLPVIFVRLQKSKKELEAGVEKLTAAIGGLEKKEQVVFADTQHLDLAMGLKAKDNSLNLALPSSEAKFVPEIQLPAGADVPVPDFPNRVLTEKLADPSEARLVYITNSPSESLALQWSTMFGELVVFNTAGEQQPVNVALRRRYRAVQQIRAAGTVGILVNTLSLSGAASLIERTKRAVTQADKKFYLFVVGKPNVAKLGNFEAIDVWVVLGCPQGGLILDTEEYFKPLVTPYELELALTNQWTGKWLTQFGDVLTEYAEDSDATVAKESSNQQEDSEPLFDLVTGKFVFNNAPLRRVRHLDIGDNDLSVQQSSSALTIRNTVSTAAEHLKKRQWQGLGSDHADITEEYAELKKGRSGIARNYNEL